jgi:hypothetical protein
MNTRDCTYNGLSIVVVLGEYLAERWVIFYKMRDGGWEALAWYVLFDSWTQGDYQQLYAPIVDVGVSLDKWNSYIVIEQDHQLRCILIYDRDSQGEWRGEELLMFPVGHRQREDEEVEAIWGRVAVSALQRLSPVHGKIVYRRMVSTLYSQRAFVEERNHDRRWLELYTWANNSWQGEAMYQSIPNNEFGVHPSWAPVVDILVRDDLTRERIVVVEEDKFLRWWHTSEWNGREWKYMTSCEILLQRVVVLHANGIDCILIVMLLHPTFSLERVYDRKDYGNANTLVDVKAVGIKMVMDFSK